MQSELLRHYDEKYRSSDFKEVKPIIVTGHPRDRFQAAVHWCGSGENYLEIGAGSGNVMLSNRNKFKNAVGVELSQTRIPELKKLFLNDDGLKIISGNVEDYNLELQENYFDWIVMIAVIEHLVEPISALKYLRKLLKPGGKILIDTSNIAKWTRRIKLLFGFFPSTASLNEGLRMYDKKTQTDLFDEGHLHYFTYRSLSKMLIERSGYSEVSKCSYGSYGVLTQLLPNLFSECIVIATK